MSQQHEVDEIRTYVILDLETTSLPGLDGNTTKITEIALISVLRQHIIQTFYDNKLNSSDKLDYLPRTINKLNECINPCKKISDRASKLTGLTNKNLECHRPFDEVLFNLLQFFFDRLDKPICIIAHNGFKFDFPILQAELHHIKKMFPDDLLCIDSIPAFKNYFSPSKNICKNVKSLTKKKQELQINSEWNTEVLDEDLISATMKVESEYRSILFENKNPHEDNSFQETNETTPTRIVSNNIKQLLRKSKSSLRSLSDTTSVHPKSGAVRKLNFNTPELENKITFPKSYKLIDIFENLFNKPMYNAHRAETDALALLECITASGPDFLNWIDFNCKNFNSVKKMW
uniref:Exonuclease domain-containing protein n=2 Tax=Clastoptera arizonana TaxID=38151 RepID=A0A1B6EAM9_9HEMI